MLTDLTLLISGPSVFTTGDVLIFCPSYIKLKMYLGSIVEETILCLGNIVAFMFGIEDKFAEVVCQTSFVGFKTFLASVFASVVNIDSNRFGKFDSKSNRFNFSQGKSFSKSGSMVISNGLASDGRS